MITMMPNKRFYVIMLIAANLLLMPLLAMQFSNEVKWTMSDFVVAGVLLFGTGLLCELVIRKVNKIRYQIAVCGVLLLVLILIWLELAVGVFGTPFAGQ